ncbi:esterase A [alpha proteobacterium U9-1i]|nr:esterase A [alpha proteobacterium U9-1i]
MVDIQGYIAPGFEPVADAFRSNFDANEEMGAGFAALRDGETLVNIWGGWADRAETTPWSRDTLTPVYSTTKGISSIVVAWCVEHGLLGYEDRVADLWPAFGANGKDRLTIAQALSHQAGVPGFPAPIDPDLWLRPSECAAAIAQLEPMWPPGTQSGYHPLTWGYIAGEIVRRATERTLGEILRTEICAPNGVDFWIGTPDSEHHRCPEMRKPTKAGSFGEITPPRKVAFFTPWAGAAKSAAEWRRVEIPSANGHGTALSVAQLYGLFATGGEIEGVRVLSTETHAQLVRRRILGEDLVLPFTMDWRSGPMANLHKFYGPNQDAIGHSGSGGSCGFGDPATRVSAGYVMNKQSSNLMGDARARRLFDALHSCV